mmetsp:Transcript_6940/g.21597  ORF Transcript_6940/g.21597 Transcript_6940/m.21597 type:complete len:281 (-) Transcript_6940:1593-2435(-)
MLSVVSFKASSSSSSFSSKVDFSEAMASKRSLVLDSNSSRKTFSRSAKEASNSLRVAFVCELAVWTSTFNASMVFDAFSRVPVNRETSASSASLRAKICSYAAFEFISNCARSRFRLSISLSSFLIVRASSLVCVSSSVVLFLYSFKRRSLSCRKESASSLLFERSPSSASSRENVSCRSFSSFALDCSNSSRSVARAFSLSLIVTSNRAFDSFSVASKARDFSRSNSLRNCAIPSSSSALCRASNSCLLFSASASFAICSVMRLRKVSFVISLSLYLCT